MGKRKHSERDICNEPITPTAITVGWDLHAQIREEITFTKERIIVRGEFHLAERFARSGELTRRLIETVVA